MRAAYNNLERAVEYCCNGIPQRPPPPPSPSTGVSPGTGSQGGEGGALDPSLLLGLVSSPQFAQIRQLVQANPSALPNILQSIAQSSPQLFQLISQNPELFEQLLLGDLPEIPQSSQSDPGAIHVTN
jgi:UV excision repair protein RAD23